MNINLPRQRAGFFYFYSRNQNMLTQIFTSLVLKSTTDKHLCESLWREITDAYTAPERHYHNLDHLRNLITELEPFRNLIQDYDTVLYSIFYHDVVYNVSSGDNEEQSAVYAEERLRRLGVNPERIQRCKAQILATKTHALLDDQDGNFFTDADLGILGKDNDVYVDYSRQIRMEYNIYPDELYFPGRMKVLQHFLDKERIYKTDPFFSKYEQQARVNLSRELSSLKSRG